MDRLYLHVKLSTDLSKYAKPQCMKNMLGTFKSTIAVKLLKEEEYQDVEKITIDWVIGTETTNATDVACRSSILILLKSSTEPLIIISFSI